MHLSDRLVVANVDAADTGIIATDATVTDIITDVALIFVAREGADVDVEKTKVKSKPNIKKSPTSAGLFILIEFLFPLVITIVTMPKGFLFIVLTASTE